MTGTATYTMARLEVSKGVYLEIRAKLIDAGYKHTLGQDSEHGERIDMHGIALALPKLPHAHPSRCVNWNVECRCVSVMEGHKGDIFGDTSDNIAPSLTSIHCSKADKFEWSSSHTGPVLVLSDGDDPLCSVPEELFNKIVRWGVERGYGEE